MKHRLLLLYTWWIRISMFCLPDVPFIMRFRGWLYGLGMKECGKNFQVAHDVIINSLEGLSVGNNVYFAMRSVFFTSYEVYIGNNVIFGPACLLTSSNHTFCNGSYRYGPSKLSKVKIEDGCWIAGHCVVLPGAVLPNSSILAAGAVLTAHLDSVKSNSIYTGIPAKISKKNI